MQGGNAYAQTAEDKVMKHNTADNLEAVKQVNCHHLHKTKLMPQLRHMLPLKHMHHPK